MVPNIRKPNHSKTKLQNVRFLNGFGIWMFGIPAPTVLYFEILFTISLSFNFQFFYLAQKFPRDVVFDPKIQVSTIFQNYFNRLWQNIQSDILDWKLYKFLAWIESNNWAQINEFDHEC